MHLGDDQPFKVLGINIYVNHGLTVSKASLEIVPWGNASNLRQYYNFFSRARDKLMPGGLNFV